MSLAVLTLVLGGARSGKSRYAQTLIGDRVAIYIATAPRNADREMQARIARHRDDRPASWITIEEPEAVAKIVRRGVARRGAGARRLPDALAIEPVCP